MSEQVAEGNYVCSCNWNIFTTKSAFDEHIKKCKIYKNILTSAKSAFVEYIIKRESDNPHVCRHCGIGFPQSSYLQDHIKTHTKMICSRCGKSFLKLVYLKRHIGICGASPECKHCGRNFSTLESLHAHLEAHHHIEGMLKLKSVQEVENASTQKTTVFPVDHSYANSHRLTRFCHQCTAGFGTLNALNMHSCLQQHEFRLNCKRCQCFLANIKQDCVLKGNNCVRTLGSKTKYSKKVHMCFVCDKEFKVLARLKRHMLIHSGELIHVCPYCSKGFNEKSNLKTHIYTHTGEKPYLCPKCGIGFAQSSSQKQHIRNQVCSNRYQCSLCPMVFADYRVMKLHMRSHPKTPSYSCSYCGKGYSEKHDLKKHMYSHVVKPAYVKLVRLEDQQCFSDTKMQKEPCMVSHSKAQLVQAASLKWSKQQWKASGSHCSQNIEINTEQSILRREINLGWIISLPPSGFTMPESKECVCGTVYSTCSLCVQGFIDPNDLVGHLDFHK